MSKTILVTGASGFIGNHVLNSYIMDKTLRCVGWSRPIEPQQTEPNTPNGVEWQRIDIMKRADVLRALDETRPDEVYHFAGFANPTKSWDHPQLALQTNLIGTLNVLEGIRLFSPAARVLIPSSALVYRSSEALARETDESVIDSPYAASKLAQELVAINEWREHKANVVVARTFNVIGPGQTAEYAVANFASQIAAIELGLAEPVVRTRNLSPVRDFLDVRDAVQAYRLLVERGKPGQIYNVCSGHGNRISDLLEKLCSLSTVRPAIQEDSGSPSRRSTDRKTLIGDPARVVAEIGWEAALSFEQVLKDMLYYWRTKTSSGVIH